MQIYFGTRGGFWDTIKFISELAAQTYKRTYTDGKKSIISWHIRPLMLWECCIPKEYENEALAKIFPYDNHGIPKIFITSLQKALGARPISKIVGPSFDVNRDHIQIVGIGIRDDKDTAKGDELV